MKVYIKKWLLILFLPLFIFSQNMWDKGELDYYSYGVTQGLSVDSMRSIIISDGNDESLPVMAYEAAVKRLYYAHEESQREFLLEHLDTEIDTSLSFPDSFYQWERYYIDAYILGLLGDETGISKMKIIAKYAPDSQRSMAVTNLAEIGIYENYEYVKEEAKKGYVPLNLLGMYGRDSQYREEVRSIIEDTLSTVDPNNWIEVSSIIDCFSWFDKEYEIEKLEEYFYNAGADSTRNLYFVHLGRIDTKGQPERCRYGLQSTEEDFWRSEYLPSYSQIEMGWESKKYLEPEFINFLLSLENVEPGSSLEFGRYYYLLKFEPAEPDSEATNSEMLEHLDSLAESTYNYHWLQDESYKNSLIEKLESAESYLSSSDEQNAAREIKRFQLSIEQVNSDSAGSYPKYVSDVGYKFLYYYPQYILDRLPEVTELENDLTAIASVEITNEGDEFQYVYTITNETGSNQPIANIYIAGSTESELSAPANWYAAKTDSVLDRFFTVFTEDQIAAGASNGGYTVTSYSLPVIGNLYIQSERFEVDKTDIMTNSYTAVTVVPSIVPDEPDAAALIDSMISYNDRAYELGWIEYEWVRSNNYTQLNNARTMINVPASAVIILTAFENILETYKNLSYFNDQTYALLKYNSVYLREILNGQ